MSLIYLFSFSNFFNCVVHTCESDFWKANMRVYLIVFRSQKNLLLSGVSSIERPSMKEFKEEFAECEREVNRIAVRNMWLSLERNL